MSFHLDPRIYSELRENGRISYADLARRTRIPRATVSHQVQEAIRHNQIKIVASVNPNLLGYSTTLHLGVRMSGSTENLVEALTETPAAVFVSQTSGVYDLIVELRGKSRTLLRSLSSSIRSQPGVKEVITVSYEHIFKSSVPVPTGGSRLADIDSKDRSLIFLLHQNGRQSLEMLAKQTGMTPGRVRSRVSRLVESQVLSIRAYYTRSPEHTEHMVGLGIWSASDRLIRELHAHPNIDFAATTLGKYDFICSLTTRNAAEAARCLDEIRALPDVTAIESWSHLVVLRDRDDVSGSNLQPLSA